MEERAGQSTFARPLARFLSLATVPVVLLGILATVWLKSRIGLPIAFEDWMLFLGFGAFAVVGSLLIAKRPPTG